MMDTIEKRLEEIFRDVFDNETLAISPEMNVQDIEGWDSLIHISLMTAIQDEFGISYGIDEITDLNVIGDILSSIEGKI